MAQNSDKKVKTLPKLPVPSLNDIISDLKSEAMIYSTSDEELQTFYAIIDAFSKPNGVGEKVHNLLVHKSLQTINWYSDWRPIKYHLEYRNAIILRSRPGVVFPNSHSLKESNKRFVIQYINKLIVSLIEFRNALKNGINPETGVKATVDSVPTLCLNQYNYMFGTCRIPGHPIDSYSFGDIESNDISIIISRLNRFYKLSLTQTQDIKALIPVIQSAVEYVLSQSNSDTIPIGIFTTLPRTEFSAVFQLLDEKALKSIIKSEFIVNIDHMIDIEDIEKDIEDKESYYKLMSKQTIFGDIDNVGNRWLDKTLQLIVVLNRSGDRVIGTAFGHEHTYVDGGPVGILMENIMKSITSFDWALDIPSVATNIEELSLICDENYIQLKAWEEISRQKYLHLIQSIDIEVLEFKDYGKEFIKSVNCSPDSWVQLAIALAFYRLMGRMGTFREVVSRRMFDHGRVILVKSVYNEFSQFFKAPNIETLMNAIETHKKLVINGINKTINISVFNCLAQEVKENKWKYGFTEYLIENPFIDLDFKDLEMIFTNDLFKRCNQISMMTTNMQSKFAEACPPAAGEGNFSGYNISANQMIFGICLRNHFNNNNFTSIAFKRELKECLKLMRNLIE